MQRTNFPLGINKSVYSIFYSNFSSQSVEVAALDGCQCSVLWRPQLVGFWYDMLMQSDPHLPCSASTVPSSFSLWLLAAQSSIRSSRRRLMACCQSTSSPGRDPAASGCSAAASNCCTTDFKTFSPAFLFQPKEAILQRYTFNHESTNSPKKSTISSRQSNYIYVRSALRKIDRKKIFILKNLKNGLDFNVILHYN